MGSPQAKDASPPILNSVLSVGEHPDVSIYDSTRLRDIGQQLKDYVRSHIEGEDDGLIEISKAWLAELSRFNPEAVQARPQMPPISSHPTDDCVTKAGSWITEPIFNLPKSLTIKDFADELDEDLLIADCGSITMGSCPIFLPPRDRHSLGSSNYSTEDTVRRVSATAMESVTATLGGVNSLLLASPPQHLHEIVKSGDARDAILRDKLGKSTTIESTRAKSGFGEVYSLNNTLKKEQLTAAEHPSLHSSHSSSTIARYRHYKAGLSFFSVVIKIMILYRLFVAASVISKRVTHPVCSHRSVAAPMISFLCLLVSSFLRERAIATSRLHSGLFFTMLLVLMLTIECAVVLEVLNIPPSAVVVSSISDIWLLVVTEVFFRWSLRSEF